MLKKLVIALALTAPALASAEGVYLVLGGAAGSADMQGIEDSYGPGAQLQTDDDVERAVVGIGAKVSPYLALEGVYMTTAENRVEDATDEDTLDHNGVQLAIVAAAPLTAQLSLTGKLSANFMNTDYNYRSGNFLIYSEEQRKVHLGAGLGLAFQMNDAVALRLGFERIMMNDVVDQDFLGADGDVDVDQASVSLLFSF